MRMTELAYETVVGLVPALDTPRFALGFHVLAEGVRPRRLGALALTGLILLQPQPVKAQNTDFAAYAQRATKYLKDEYNAMEGKLHNFKTEYNWELDWMRSGVMAYKSYQQASAMYRRLTGQINVALGSTLPTVEIETDAGNGETEVIRVRPIMGARDRSTKFYGDRFNVSLWGMNPKDHAAILSMIKNGDLDIDRFIVMDQDPDKNKDAMTIRTEAIDDAIRSWHLYQKAAGVDRTNHALPNDVPYIGVQAIYQDAFLKRTADLQRNAQKAQNNFGDDSPEYRRQLGIYSDWVLSVSRGQAKADADRDTAEMKAIDMEALRSMDSYATASTTMRLANQRRRIAEANKKENSKLHRADADDPITKLDKWLGFSALAVSLDGITKPGAKKVEDAPSRQVVGDAIEANINSEVVSGDLKDMSQAESRKTLSDEQDKLNVLAQRKRSVEARQQQTAKLMKGADSVEGQRLDAALTVRALDASFLSAMMPEGQVLVLPRALARLIPGTQPSENAEKVVRAAFDGATTKALDGVSSGVREAFSGPPVGWGFLTLWAKSFGSAYRAFTGKSFDLTRMGVE